MKVSMTSADIKACVTELQELTDSRVEKVYHHVPDEIRFKLRGAGRKDLVVEAGRRIHLTKFPREAPRLPSSFAMLLRKHLEGFRLESVEQHDFDRVVVLTFRGWKGGEEKRYRVVAELFSKGNVILCRDDFEIVMPLKHGIFKSGDKYEFPEPKLTPFDLSTEKLRELFESEKERKRDVVRVLAMNGLGGLYAEEVCLRAGIDKNKKASEVSDEEVERIARAIGEVFDAIVKGNFKPHIVLKDGKYVDVLPVELQYYAEYEKKYFNTFNEALDEYYTELVVRECESEEKEEKVNALSKRLEKQLEKLKEFESEFERLRKTGDYIYENWSRVEAIHSAFIKARKEKSWQEIERIVKSSKLSEVVKSVHPEKNSVTITMDGLELELSLDRTLPQIAEMYYERAKKIKSKIDGLLKAIDKTKEEMKKAEELEARKLARSIRVVRKREWYERFRWTITSDGYLVIGGRNARMNEEIVSRYMESKDLFFHTQTPGAPVVILKRGQEAPETSIEEAAQFAASYSTLWKEGKYSGEVYYVKPEQVKKSAKHGEYLARGSFYIEGKRNYLNVELNCAVGVELEKLRLLAGPVSAVKKHCDYFVEVEIGDLPQSEVAVLVAKKLVEMSGNNHIVRGIATPDEVARLLPPGTSRIKE